jgi:hypothetical protein
MSTLTVTTINTANSSTPLTFETGNSAGGKFVLNANGGMTLQSNSTTNAISINTAGSVTLIGTISDSAGNIRDVPFGANQTSTYTLVANDAGKMISTTANVAIPASVFTGGQNISIYNNSAANISITSAAGVTAYLIGTSNTSTRTLTQRGIATVICVAANTFVVTGGGIV